MREAAEAPDDVAMPLGMRQTGLAETPGQRDGALLVGQASRNGRTAGRRRAAAPPPPRGHGRPGSRRPRSRAPSHRWRTCAACRERRCAETGRAAPAAPALRPASPASASSPRAAASYSGRKRSRKRRSNSASLANQSPGPPARQKSTTAAASARIAANRRRAAGRSALRLPARRPALSVGCIMPDIAASGDEESMRFLIASSPARDVRCCASSALAARCPAQIADARSMNPMI